MLDATSQQADGSPVERLYPFLLVVMVGAFFGPLLLTDSVPLLGDLSHLFYPGFVFLRESLRQGVLPLWNPYTGCGEPFLADVQRGVFYPPNWVYVVMPTCSAMVVSAAFHVLLGGLGAYGLLRGWGVSRAGALLAGVSYAFNAYMITKVEFPSQLGGTAWCPVVLATYAWWLRRGGRRAFILTSGAIAMQFLAGHPEMVFFTTLALVIYALCAGWYGWRARHEWIPLLRPILGLAACGLLAILMVMAQLLPSVEALRVATRSRAANPDLDSSSVHPLSLFTLLIPSLYGVGGWGGVYWAPSVISPSVGGFYIGLVPIVVLLAATIRRVAGGALPPDAKDAPGGGLRLETCFLLIVFAFFFLYAMGGYSPFYGICRRLIPPTRYFIWPAKCLVCVVLALSCLAGIALDRLVRGTQPADLARAPRRRVLMDWGTVLVMAAIGLCVGACLLCFDSLGRPLLLEVFNLEHIFQDDEMRIARIPWDVMLRDSVKLPLLGIVTAVLLKGYCSWPRFRAYGGGVLALLSFVDLFIVNHYLLQAGPAEVLEKPSSLTEWLNPPDRSARFYAFEHALPEELQARWEAFMIDLPVEASRIPMPPRFNESPPARSVRTLREISYGYLPAADKVYNTFSIRNFLPKDISTMFIAPIVVNAPLANRRRMFSLLNCDRFLCVPDLPRTMALGQAAETALLFKMPEVMPRAYVVGGLRVAHGQRGVMAALLSDSFDPWRVAVLDREDAEEQTYEGLTPGRIRHTILRHEHRMNAVDVELELESPGLLVLSQTYAPGWTATVNGQSVPILRVNLAFQGLRLPAGRARVLMTYQPNSVWIGMAVSAATVILLAILLVPVSRTRESSPP
ncbi:MAG: YfhO family protein [Phycisphaerae bacterium]|nr:YfhO family protein [Phycisphaerae bacterium]